MAGDGRNAPCACGSGKKTKKCCGEGGRVAGALHGSGGAASRRGATRRHPALPDQCEADGIAEMFRRSDELMDENPQEAARLMSEIMGRITGRLDAAMSNRVVGFAGVGKLKPGSAEGRVFAATAADLAAVTRDGCNDTPEETPVYSMLTPHHRVELLAEVATGLLDPTAPLPRDGLEQHAAFLAVWIHVLTNVEMEIDEERMASSDGAPSGDLDTESLHALTRELMAEGKFHQAEERRNTRKLERRLRKDEAVGASGVPESSDESRDVSSLLGQVRRVTENGGLDFGRPPITPEEVMRMAAHEPRESHRYWRVLLLAAFHERYGANGGSAVVTLHPDTTDVEAWVLQCRMFVGSGFEASAELNELQERCTEDAGSIAENPESRRRYKSLRVRVATATREFEAEWSAARTMRACCALMLIDPSPVSDFPLLRPNSFPEAVERHNRRTEAAVRAVETSGVMSVDGMGTRGATGGDDLPNLSECDARQSAYMGLARSVREAVRLRWAAAWHAEMRRPGTGRRYDDVSHRLDALRRLPDSALLDTPASWAPTLGVFSIDSLCGSFPSPTRISPSDWRAKRDGIEAESSAIRCYACDAVEVESTARKFQKCGACNVATYCSPECQREHWKRAEGGHKEECAMFARLLSSR